MDTAPITNLWQTKYATAYRQNEKTIICYRFPHESNREAALIGKYGLLPGDRMEYYQTLSCAVERHFSIAELLHSAGVPNVISYSKTYQKKESNGAICVYAICDDAITPVTQSLLSEETKALDVLDMILRLSTTILRDVAKPPLSLSLRCLDLDEVFLTGDNRILLGGFYYATSPLLSEPPPFLPECPATTPPYSFLESPSKIGANGADMQMISLIAWNLFSGLPWNTAHTSASFRIHPQHAPTSLLEVLKVGLCGKDQDCSVFRKQLLQCRKELAKTEFADIIIPFPTPMEKQYQYNHSRQQPDGI